MKKVEKLFIKGLKEPLELDGELLAYARRLIDSLHDPEFSHLRDSDFVSIGNKWSGKKGDLRYIISENTRDPYEQMEYSDSELSEVANLLSSYAIKDGDDEFNAYVEKFYRMVLEGERIFHSLFIKTRLESLREKFVIEGKVNDDDLLLAEIQKMVRERLVGSITLKGKNNLLKDKGMINILENGSIEVRKENLIPYKNLMDKISILEDKQSARAYAENKEALQYERIAVQQLADEMTLHEE